MEMAQTVSKLSKDPSTKIGSILIRPDNTVASVGYNGFPSNTLDEQHHFTDKDFKYKYIIHGEENAILNCQDHSLKNYSIFIYGLPPCTNCLSKIINCGISSIYYKVSNESSYEKMKADWETSLQIIRVNENLNYINIERLD